MVNKLEREHIYLNTILLLAAVVVDEHWAFKTQTLGK